MTKKQLQKRQDEIIAKIRAFNSAAEANKTAFYLCLVEVAGDPERAWAGGDPGITFEQFLEEHEICARATYQKFCEGMKFLKQTSPAKSMPMETLAQTIGHEAVSRIRRLKADKSRDRFVREVMDLREQHGSAPASRRLEVLLTKIEKPAPTNAKEKERSEVGKLRAENQRLRAREALVQPLQEEIARLQEQLRALKAENDRLARGIRVVPEKASRRKAAA